MTDLLMLDSVSVPVFSGLKFDALAGYVGGNWPDFSAECAAYPALAKAGRVVPIAVNASEQARILDCETGDATPGQCGPWVKAQLARGVHLPGVYANASTMPGVQASLKAAGLKRENYVLWVADWTFSPGILPGFDAQQWSDRYAGRNIDGSSTLASFFADVPQPPHVNPVHYDWFSVGPFNSPRWGKLDERALVEQYDKLRPKPVKDDVTLDELQSQLAWLADRVRTVAKFVDPYPAPSPTWGAPSPSWNKFHRGYRFQQLVHRAQGRRFV